MTTALYYWEGRNLLMDTIVHRKRLVAQSKGRSVYCPFDVRRWVLPPEDETMGTAWEQLARAHRRYLNQISSSRRSDVKAKAVWHFVVEHVGYRAEQKGRDIWQFPPETLLLRRGDCEDKAFLCASLLLAAGIPAERVRVVIGALVCSGEPPQGHAWPMYRTAGGAWCILEPNLPHLPVRVAPGPEANPVVPARAVGIHRAVFLMADRVAADGCREQYVPLVCFNHRSVWTVEQRHPGAVRGAVALEPDWTRNPTFDQILRWHQRGPARSSTR